VWLSKSNRTTELATRGEVLAVHVLATGHHDLAELFGGETGDEVDKLALCETIEGPGGVPVLAQCPSYFVGRLVAVLDTGGDHVCVVLEPISASAHPLDPLRLLAVDDVEAGHDAHETRPTSQQGATRAAASSSATVTSASSATNGSSSPG
jgi:flavin reductase (DIM6/NTAB) family NADH-FMN oxidoreductase RutF